MSEQILSMPRLGQTMEHGTVLRHHVAAGESFVAGDPLYTVETEKVETEIEAKSSGRLVRWTAAEGVELPVGAEVAVIAAPGAGRVRAVPRARSLAREHGIDLAAIAAESDAEIVTADDVRRHIEGAAAAVQQLTGHRRAMASSMARSWATIPHFVESIQIDAGGVLDHRAALGAEGNPVPTVTAYLIEALAGACREVPLLHATLAEDRVQLHEQVDMAIAVDTDHGLVAPIMRRVDALSLDQIAAGLRDLTRRARARELAIGDVEGGNVALSNLGPAGVELGAPIIPPEQASMLFAGAIADRAVVVDGEVVPRPTMWITLACDHRLIDGATAARGLRHLRQRLESPGHED